MNYTALLWLFVVNSVSELSYCLGLMFWVARIFLFLLPHFILGVTVPLKLKFCHLGIYLIQFISEKQGVQACTFYLQNGHCKFGSTCKFDHPMGTMRYNPSASSLIDMPVAPYPVGNLLATLAPSSTSSELRPELISGESYSTRMPSSANTSSSSVGLIFSQTGSVSLSEVQLSSQSSVPLSSSRNTRQGGEVRRSS